MNYSPEIQHRRSIRLKGHDYSRPGAYFVTICVEPRECLFGEMVGEEMLLNPLGEIVVQEWLRSAEVRSHVELDAFVVMPNHVHGIIILMDDSGKAADCVGATRRVAPTERPRAPTSGSIGAIIGQFKSITAKRINGQRGTPGAPVWQRNYFEHVIRSEEDLHRIREYIVVNPARWAWDAQNPAAETLWQRQREGLAVEQYLEGYRKRLESLGEIEAAHRVGSATLEAEPWE